MDPDLSVSPIGFPIFIKIYAKISALSSDFKHKACVRYGVPLTVITATKGMVNVRINSAESYMKVLRKTKESVENLSIDKQNSAIGDQNPTIGNQSMAIGDSKQAIAKEKIDFRTIAIRI